MTAKQPTISVVISTYNRRLLLERTLNSVQTQTRPAHEIIVVDNESSDGTLEYLQRLAPRVRAMTCAARGCGPVRNVGAAVATGEYIALLDDDDLWLPWTLETYASAISSADQPAMIVGEFKTFIDDREVGDFTAGPLNAEFRANYLSHSHDHRTIPSCWCIRRDVYARIGGFWDKPFNHQDMDFLLRAAPYGAVKVHSPVCVGWRRGHECLTRTPHKVFRGLQEIVELERRGHYPGGATWAAQRRRMITGIVKKAIESHGDVIDPRVALTLLADTSGWFASRRRARFVLRSVAGLLARSLGAEGLGRVMIRRTA